MSTATLPDALSDAARSFASGPHRFVIGGERPEAADGRTFETLDPSTGRRIADVPYASAGAAFHAAISSGKFHGMICAATPTGSLRV